jgi:hypothetical protein
MTDRNYIDTEEDVVSMVMSYESYITLAIVHHGDEVFKIKAYFLKDHKFAFEKVFHGKYLKMNLID